MKPFENTSVKKILQDFARICLETFRKYLETFLQITSLQMTSLMAFRNINFESEKK